MNVFSAFDGISIGQLALKRAGIPVDKYFASEIKPYAMEVTKDNFPNTVFVGDVTKVKVEDYPKIDLFMGGSPCQDLSAAMRDRDGLEGEKSKLFWEFIRLLKEFKPRYFFLENVAGMTNNDKEIISEATGVEPIRINSSRVSAQLRDRYYWTNIPNVDKPDNKRIMLKDILTSGYTDRRKSRALLVSDSRPLTDKKRMYFRYTSTGFTTIVFESEDMNPDKIRYFNQTELERLQTVPEGYTRVLNRNQAADVLGDCWTTDVIAHVFGYMKGNPEPVNNTYCKQQSFI